MTSEQMGRVDLCPLYRWARGVEEAQRLAPAHLAGKSVKLGHLPGAFSPIPLLVPGDAASLPPRPPALPHRKGSQHRDHLVSVAQDTLTRGTQTLS